MSYNQFFFTGIARDLETGLFSAWYDGEHLGLFKTRRAARAAIAKAKAPQEGQP